MQVVLGLGSNLGNREENLARALDALSQLRDCEAHSSVILSAADSGIYSRLGLRLTCSPQYQTNQLFHK